jgi:branched-chain amino acid aminotransferase
MTRTIPSPLDCSRLKRTLTDNPKAVPSPTSAASRSQSVCTDHMILARWTSAHGWEAPNLKPSGPLEIPPTASVLHYAIECFEGLKLYRAYDGGLRLFRPAKNCERMRTSAARVTLPDFDPRELEGMILHSMRRMAQDGCQKSMLANSCTSGLL